MNDKLLFDCWCVMFTKLSVYEKHLEIRGFLGVNTLRIPLVKVASVSKGLTGIKFETTGGGKTETVQPWDGKNVPKIIDLVLDRVSKN